MKIDINKIKLVPENLGFNFCQYGGLSPEVKDWSDFWKFELVKSGPYTNIVIGDVDISKIFIEPKVYEYLDGFSPNLNKHLHMGHLSNLIIANAIQKLGIAKKAIAIMGDTVTGDVTKEDALKSYEKYCNDFGYKVDKMFFASEMKLKDESILEDGVGEWSGSKIFNLGLEKIVGVKSSGMTSYFYQDIALAEFLNSPTIYLTGLEQSNHFNSVKKLYPETKHIGLGLVLLDGKKMSSSEGNVIYLDDFIKQLMFEFNDIELVYNILAGQILKSGVSVNKSIDSNLIKNPKTSMGLYMSYTMAHIKSCGVETKKIYKYKSKELQFSEMKSKINLSPNILFESLIKHCKMINKMYETHYIKDNKENIEIFSNLISDLELGMSKLGMFSIKKV